MAEFNPKKMLDALRWKEDTAVFNPEGEHVWLKPCFNAEGKRIGITDCCPVDAPCEHHAKLKLEKR